MYGAIVAQPSAFLDVATSNMAAVRASKQLLEDSKRVFLVGTGTSYHAAWAAQYVLRSTIKNKRVSALPSIDFALYGEEINNEDLVIVFSHRGTKQYSLQSLERSKQAGAKTILITGRNKNIDTGIADIVIQTVEQEKSSAHTISYTAALAVIVALIGGPVKSLATTLTDSIEQEQDMKKEAARAKSARKIWIVGSGPSEVTAKEAALKIKETSYMQAEGLDTEELIHGPFQSAEAEDFFILIAPKGKAQDRTLQLVKAIQVIGADYLAIGGPGGVLEEYTTISCIVPLQLLTYHLALVKGTNPDNFRLDDSRFAKVLGLIKL